MNPHALPMMGGWRLVRRPQRRVTAAFLVSASLLAEPALAQGLNWLNIARQTPISQFTDADVDLFIETGTSALEQAQDGEEKPWENSATGNSGSITVVRSFERDSLECREVVIENQSRSFYARSSHNFCRKDDETWRWVPPSR